MSEICHLIFTPPTILHITILTQPRIIMGRKQRSTFKEHPSTNHKHTPSIPCSTPLNYAAWHSFPIPRPRLSNHAPPTTHSQFPEPKTDRLTSPHPAQRRQVSNNRLIGGTARHSRRLSLIRLGRRPSRFPFWDFFVSRWRMGCGTDDTT